MTYLISRDGSLLVEDGCLVFAENPEDCLCCLDDSSSSSDSSSDSFSDSSSDSFDSSDDSFSDSFIDSSDGSFSDSSESSDDSFDSSDSESLDFGLSDSSGSSSSDSSDSRSDSSSDSSSGSSDSSSSSDSLDDSSETPCGELFIRWSIWINNSRIAMPQFDNMTSISGTAIGFNAQTNAFDLETGFTAVFEAPDFLTDCEPGVLVTATMSAEFEPSTDGVFENSRIISNTLPQLGTNLGGETFSRTDTFALQPDGAPTGSYLAGAVYQLPVTNFIGTNVVDVSFGYSVIEPQE